MSVQNYTLRWDTYTKSLKDMVQNMLSSNSFTDVTLVTDDQKQKKAHKFMLSEFSDVFKGIIGSIPEQEKNPVIYLKGIKYEELESALEFIYFGETKFPEDKVNEFLDVAKNLGIKELKEIRIKHENIPSTINQENEINIIDHQQVLIENESNQLYSNQSPNMELERTVTDENEKIQGNVTNDQSKHPNCKQTGYVPTLDSIVPVTDLEIPESDEEETLLSDVETHPTTDTILEQQIFLVTENIK